MILGVDVSTLREARRLGCVWKKDGRSVDPLRDIASHNGVSLVRLRLWVDPYDEKKTPYLGGTCDFENFIALAKEAKELGCKIDLDPHFSDFWCDPGKQTLPKAWQHLDEEELLDVLRKYCRKTFEDCRDNGIVPEIVQLGNEVTNGMLWPYAKLTDGNPRGNYDRLIKALSIISEEARLAFPECKRLIHLERSYDNATYREYFDQVAPKVPFEIIGMSYYPYWHHGFDELFANVDDMKARYGKEVAIIETGYGFTMEDYVVQPQDDSTLVVTEEFLKEQGAKLPYPLTPEGQASFVEELLRLGEKHHLYAICYWEPFWIPGEGICWASKAGQRYIHETKAGTRNEWANQCFYDYQGNSLPALAKFCLPKGGK